MSEADRFTHARQYPDGRWQNIQTDDQTIHIHLLDGGHKLNGWDCWCDPKFEQNGRMTLVIHKDVVIVQLN